MEDHIVLYRQYRPLTFDDVVGQEAAVSALRQSVVSHKLAHAYLFCGQHGTGKTTIAKIFSRAVNCEHPVNGNPCNECPTCKGILDGSVLDVTEMDAASNNGVDDVRPILQEVNFAPTRTTYKVYIIDEVHMLSKGAFNALLKTIEEPPKHVIFLFATTESDKIPATIMSRCQRYDFKRIPIDLIVGRLREVCGKSGIKASDDALRLIASKSDGALRDALSLLDQISAIAGADNEISSQDVEKITGTVDSSFLFKMANCLIDGRFDELIDLCEILNSSGKNQVRFTLDLASYFRDLLIIRVKADPIIYLPYPKETIKDMYQTASKVNADTLTGIINFLSKEYADLRKSPDIATRFELMLMRLCGRKSNLPVTPIVIPDFEKKQAAKAPEITLNEATPSSSSAAAITEAPEDKKEDDDSSVKETKTEEASDDNKEDDAKDTEEKKAEKTSFTAPAPYRPQPSSAPAPYRPQPSSASTGIFSFTSAAREAASDEPKAPITSFFTAKKEETSIPVPPVPEDDDDTDSDDEYIPPAEPSDDPAEPTIFSYIPEEQEKPLSFGTDEADDPLAPETEPSKPFFSSQGVFSHLSPSFFDDIKSDPEEEPQAPAPEPAHDKRRSQLVEQTEKSGIIIDGPSRETVRTPSVTGEEVDIALRWSGITSKLHESNDNIACILEHTSFKKNNSSAYIVFEDSDSKAMANLRGSTAFRQIAAGIKEEFGVEHLYLSSNTQYINQMKKEQETEQSKKLDNLSEKLTNLGIPNDVHFGDDE